MPISKPEVGAAVFCEKVLEQKTGVLSAIRIIDTITVSGTILGQPAVAPITLFVLLRAGDTSGEYKLTLRGFKPSGAPIKLTTSPEGEMLTPPIDVILDSETRLVANVVFNLNVAFVENGWYRFEVLVDGERLTSVPLRLKREDRADRGQLPN